MKNNWITKKINNELVSKEKRNWFINLIAWGRMNVGIWVSLLFFICSVIIAIVYAGLFYSDAYSGEELEKLSKAWEITLPITALIFGAFLALWVIGETYRNVIKDYQETAKANQSFVKKSEILLNEIEDLNVNLNRWKAPLIWAQASDLYIEWQTYSLLKESTYTSFLESYSNNALLNEKWNRFLNNNNEKMIILFGKEIGNKIYNEGNNMVWETLYFENKNYSHMPNEIEYIKEKAREIEFKYTKNYQHTKELQDFLITLYIQCKGVKFLYNTMYKSILEFKETVDKTNDKINEIISYCSKHKHKKKFCWTSLYAIKHINEIIL